MQAAERDDDRHRPLIEAIRQGDPHAMTELIRDQERWVRAVIFGVMGRRHDVDDVAQRVWMKAWREARRLKDPSRWRTWLYRIARNAATDELRKRQRRRKLDEGLQEQAPEPGARSVQPDHELAAAERERIMLDAIASLPELYREPFVLKHLEDWSYQEIGDLLGLGRDTVETRLVRARRMLRERLAGRV